MTRYQEMNLENSMLRPCVHDERYDYADCEYPRTYTLMATYAVTITVNPGEDFDEIVGETFDSLPNTIGDFEFYDDKWVEVD